MHYRPKGAQPPICISPDDIEVPLMLLDDASLGLFMRILARIAKSPKDGYLVYESGAPYTLEDICKTLSKNRGKRKLTRDCLTEIERQCILKRDNSGTWFDPNWISHKPIFQDHTNRSHRIEKARRIGTHTDQQWRALVDACGGKCVKCGHSHQLTKDHVIPVVLSGSDDIGNIQPLCHRCNSTKGRSIVDWVPVEIRNSCVGGRP